MHELSDGQKRYRMSTIDLYTERWMEMEKEAARTGYGAKKGLQILNKKEITA